VKSVSELQSLKLKSDSVRTEEGMQIDFSDEQHKNADSSIRSRCDPGAKVASESDEQYAKQCAPMT
jgi:hypothetical protein